MKPLKLSIILYFIVAMSIKAQINFEAFIADGSESIKFINNTIQKSSDPYMLFFWKMGDGVEQFAGKELIHNYESPGTYNISLIGITKSGIRDTFRKTINIPNDLRYISKSVEEKQKQKSSALVNLESPEIENNNGENNL